MTYFLCVCACGCSAFQARAKVFLQSMDEYIANRQLYMDMLARYVRAAGVVMTTQASCCSADEE